MKLTTGLLLPCLLTACAAAPPSGSLRDPELRPYLGTYGGSFDSALTSDPGDDLNYNPCQPSETDPCPAHQQPLANVLMTLRRQPDGTVSLQFFEDPGALSAERPLDLLGAGCGTHLGAQESFERARDAGGTRLTVTLPLTADNRLCLGKLRPVSEHRVRVVLEGAEPGTREARVIIDKAVRDANYLYVKEGGVRRRVRIDLDNTVRENHQTHYRVCIENDLGEYDRCVLTDRRFRSFVLPVPLPNGAAVNYTWWQELSPTLRRTSGRYAVEQYVGRFELLKPVGP